MPSRDRKVRRLRGSRHHGWGQVGGHLSSGGRGGKGKAGLMKHKWTWTVKYEPDHFGHNRFHPPSQREVSWVNVGLLDGLKSKVDSQGVLNLTHLGYEKLLGQGIVKDSFRIMVSAHSRSAREKVEKAGGEIITGSKE